MNPLDQTKITFTAAVSEDFKFLNMIFLIEKVGNLLKNKPRLQSSWLNDGDILYHTERSTNGNTRLMILDTELEGAKPKSIHGSNFGSCSQPSFFYPNQ